MRRRGIRRFALEVVFLTGVAAALTIADLRPAAVIAGMAAAWVVVALLEWTAWLDEPHYGRGLPPRYYVPHVALPPPRPIEQYRGGYPVLEPDDAPTFVASTREWAAALGDWRVADAPGEDTVIAEPDVEDSAIVALPPPIHELEQTVAADFGLYDLEEEETEDPAIEAHVMPALEPEERAKLEPLVLEPRGKTTVAHHVDPLTATGRTRFRRRRAVEASVIEVLDGPAPDRTLPLRLRQESKVKAR